jgi:MerR family redox-sensitive transcriptional activator SoxR
MESLTISEVARQVGVQASAIRYYESRKILPAPQRIGGQRRYGPAAVHQLAVIRRAQEAGFSLEEIRQIFFGFRPSTPVSARWRKLAESKLAELDEQLARIQSMKELLERLRTRCRCETVDECGAAILRKGFSGCAIPTGLAKPTGRAPR